MKILIIRLSSLGDIILTQPVCTLLQKAFPDAELSYMCKEQYTMLPQLFDPPLKVIPYHKSLAFHIGLRNLHYDLVIDLHTKFSSMLVSYLLNAKRRVRYDKQRHIRSRIVAGNHSLAINSTVDLYVSALGKLGIPTSWQAPQMRLPDLPEKLLPQRDVKKIAVIPGATHATKRYPAAQYLEFINMNPQWEFLLFGSKDDHELCAGIARAAQANCTDYSGKLNLIELYQAMAQCDLIISGDTGPMHLAATLAKPQIAIFGATHPRLGFKPINPQAKILCAGLPCQPCHLHGGDKCPLGHFTCMKQITAESLSSVVYEMLG
ncbi:MAG: glycosyltransferase family 9 protein [Candidatus Cloacimonetes bacterium]|nr:glycosyltransferase family 9 protein [Candidatus Cloacimonadota bacterium]